MPKARRAIAFRQLCLLATEQLTPEPTIDDAEWKARIQDRAHALGFLTPWAAEVYRAMDAVEQAEAKRGRPRVRQRPPSFVNPSHTNLETSVPAPRTINNLPPEIRDLVESTFHTTRRRTFDANTSPDSARSVDGSLAPEVRTAMKAAINAFWAERSSTCNQPWCAHCRAVCDGTRVCPECSGAPVCEACFKEIQP